MLETKKLVSASPLSVWTVNDNTVYSWITLDNDTIDLNPVKGYTAPISAILAEWVMERKR